MNSLLEAWQQARQQIRSAIPGAKLDPDLTPEVARSDEEQKQLTHLLERVESTLTEIGAHEKRFADLHHKIDSKSSRLTRSEARDELSSRTADLDRRFEECQKLLAKK